MSVHTTEHLDGFLGLLGVETDLLEEAPEAFAAHTAPLERPTTADARHEVNEEFGGARIGTPSTYEQLTVHLHRLPSHAK